MAQASTDMAREQLTPAAAASSRSLSSVLVTLAVCGAGGAIAAGILFGVQYSEASIPVGASRLLLLLLWLGVFTTLLYVNRRTLFSVGNGAGRRFGLGVVFAMVAALVIGLAVIVALTAYVHLGGRL
jgi:hypothetical protein